MAKWTAFPYELYDFDAARTKKLWARLHAGDAEPAPKDAKVLYVGEARAYYAKQPVLWSTAFDQHPFTAMSREVKTSQELLALLRARGITHVYVNYAEFIRLWNGYYYMVDANWDLIWSTLQEKRYANVVHESGRRIVYELAK